MDNRLTTPDLADRPFGLTVERRMTAPPAALYRAWTGQWDRWFAAPGSVSMDPDLIAPFFFVTEHEGKRYPHYGRYLRREPDRLVELTWVTGRGGTEGAETVVTVTIEPSAGGSLLTLSHRGFYEDAHRRQHEEAWPKVLAHLDGVLLDQRR
jgi:uncharacterized protein YndB with AHSA1/START domain